ncbi:MAG: hypothetical protein JRJ14_07045 [Deltaproteobacteria bacterium]|nr:hypothetical protein [Deltaproteobacteria bacterium]
MPEQQIGQTIKGASENFGVVEILTHLEVLPNETLAHRYQFTPLTV